MFVHPIVSNFERRNINNYIKTRGINRHCPWTGTYDYPNEPGLPLDNKQDGQALAAA